MESEEDVIFWTVLLVGFFLLLRKCNLLSDSTPKFDLKKQLTPEDLEFEPDHVKATLRWTKNNQFGNKPLGFALPVISGSVLCPVSALLLLQTFNAAHGSQSSMQ